MYPDMETLTNSFNVMGQLPKDVALGGYSQELS